MGDSMVQDQSEPLKVQTGDGTTPDRRSLAVTLYRRRLAVFAFMLVYGLGMSSWVVRTPAVRDLLNASTAQMGLVLLGMVTWRSFKGHFSAEEHHGVEIPGIYWHFVDVMWIVVYTTIYVL